MKKKILVITKNLLSYEALYRAFRAAECEILLAVNLRESIDHCRTQHFDLVVVDLDWPIEGETDSREVARQMLRIDRLPPVIVISARSEVRVAVEALGVAAVAEKPVDVPALLAMAYTLMNNQKHMSNDGSERVPFRHLPRNTRAFREALYAAGDVGYSRTVPPIRASRPK